MSASQTDRHRAGSSGILTWLPRSRSRCCAVLDQPCLLAGIGEVVRSRWPIGSGAVVVLLGSVTVLARLALHLRRLRLAGLLRLASLQAAASSLVRSCTPMTSGSAPR